MQGRSVSSRENESVADSCSLIETYFHLLLEMPPDVVEHHVDSRPFITFTVSYGRRLLVAMSLR